MGETMQVDSTKKLEEKLEENKLNCFLNNSKCGNISINKCEEEMHYDISQLKTIGDLYRKEVVERAKALNIPFNCKDWAWSDLSDIVCEYETLLEEAKEYGIDWDLSEYDPVALQQEIEYYQRQGAQERCHSFGYYYATRGC